MKLSFEHSKWFQKLFHLRKITKIRDYINPLRDWTIGLFAALFVFFTGVGFIAFDFYLVFIEPPPQDVRQSTFNYSEKEVVRYATLYKTKEDTFNKLRLERPTPKQIPSPVPEGSVKVDVGTTTPVVDVLDPLQSTENTDQAVDGSLAEDSTNE